MPQTLNFDDITYDTITIRKQGREWILRDDVPMEILARVFGLQALSERIQQRTATLASQAQDGTAITASQAQTLIEEALAEASAEALAILGEIFRYTDASVRDEDLASLFTYEEKGAIINVFFTRRLSVLSALSDATTDGGPNLRPASATEATRPAAAARPVPSPRPVSRRATSTSPAATRRMPS